MKASDYNLITRTVSMHLALSRAMPGGGIRFPSQRSYRLSQAVKDINISIGRSNKVVDHPWSVH